MTEMLIVTPDVIDIIHKLGANNAVSTNAERYVRRAFLQGGARIFNCIWPMAKDEETLRLPMHISHVVADAAPDLANKALFPS